jgi:hypothetical protein
MKETIKNRVVDALSSINQRTQGLCEKLNAKIEEMQLGFQPL